MPGHGSIPSPPSGDPPTVPFHHPQAQEGGRLNSSLGPPSLTGEPIRLPWGPWPPTQRGSVQFVVPIVAFILPSFVSPEWGNRRETPVLSPRGIQRAVSQKVSF